MKKSIIGMMILSLLFVASAQNSQAKGGNGKVVVKQEKSIKGKKHPSARTNHKDVNNSIKGKKHPNANTNKAAQNRGNVGVNKRLEDKEKAIQRRQEGKEKAIERRLQGKQNAIENRSQNAPQKGHRGHGKHKRNLNNAQNPHHINRGNAVQQNKNIKQEKK